MASRRLLAAAGALQHSGEEAAKGSGELLVYVVTESEKVPVTVDAGGTVGCLTEAAAAALRLDSGRPVLLLKGQRLDSGGRDVPLADCGVSQEECLSLERSAGFSCFDYTEPWLSVEDGADGSITMTKLSREGVSAYFDPLLSTDCSAQWTVEVAGDPTDCCFVVGVTALSPAECDEGLMHWGAKGQPKQLWAFDNDGCSQVPPIVVTFTGSAVFMTLTMHRRTFSVRAETDATGEYRIQPSRSMDLPASVPVRFFVYFINGGGLRVRMEEQ
eukprot:TRINITY_DN615_c0_g1_i8.p1 TRINITY_DN615_c0_g1~~TRINITY_DN615_c0_g1_i8.p1  ORF type:complete len:272 (+),score=80.54 TRINITY_DN615_c0_g1_i8:59-874(+)